MSHKVKTIDCLNFVYSNIKGGKKQPFKAQNLCDKDANKPPFIAEMPKKPGSALIGKAWCSVTARLIGVTASEAKQSQLIESPRLLPRPNKSGLLAMTTPHITSHRLVVCRKKREKTPFLVDNSTGGICEFPALQVRFSTNYPLSTRIYYKILQVSGSFGIKFVTK